MAASPANQLTALIADMFSTGLVDKQFQVLRSMREPSSPYFSAEVITTFCEDGERIIRELTNLLERPVVDFDAVKGLLHQFKGAASCVGAQKVTNSCLQLIEFNQQKNRDGCINTLNNVRTEFYEVRSKFLTMIQLERQIPGF